jgi:hypothetical protein
MAGIMRSANRPKTAKHLRSASQKQFVNRAKEDRDRDHALSDSWAERRRLEDAARVEAAISERKARELAEVEVERVKDESRHNQTR